MVTPRNELHRPKPWWRALWHATPLTALVLGLFYHWFAVADRHIVFLYNHDMGPLYPDTSPFSFVTSSRYWMAGLVATGAVMVLYVTVNTLWGRLVAVYRSPLWWRVWGWCALPLLVGIPAITIGGDSCDSRFYSDAQVDTRLQALLETIDAGRKTVK